MRNVINAVVDVPELKRIPTVALDIKEFSFCLSLNVNGCRIECNTLEELRDLLIKIYSDERKTRAPLIID